MTDQQHLITPSPEQIYLWQNDWKLSSYEPGITETIYVATQAARWGADQELEACCEWLDYNYPSVNCAALRAARRPKPPSLKEQALAEINEIEGAMYSAGLGCDFTATRRALKQLDD